MVLHHHNDIERHAIFVVLAGTLFVWSRETHGSAAVGSCRAYNGLSLRRPVNFCEGACVLGGSTRCLHLVGPAMYRSLMGLATGNTQCLHRSGEGFRGICDCGFRSSGRRKPTSGQAKDTNRCTTAAREPRTKRCTIQG